MYNSDTDLLFPTRIIPDLINLRGSSWKKLVESLLIKDKTNEEILAFVLLMVRINGCITCNSDSFRAMRGCTLCATQNIKRYKGTEETLLNQYSKSKHEIETYLKFRNNQEK